MAGDKNLVDAITYRVMKTIGTASGRHLEPAIREAVAGVLREVQHRLYQDVSAELLAIAFDLDPDTARAGRHGEPLPCTMCKRAGWFCEHCGPMSARCYPRDGTSWCLSCIDANGWVLVNGRFEE